MTQAARPITFKCPESRGVYHRTEGYKIREAVIVSIAVLALGLAVWSLSHSDSMSRAFRFEIGKIPVAARISLLALSSLVILRAMARPAIAMIAREGVYPVHGDRFTPLGGGRPIWKSRWWDNPGPSVHPVELTTADGRQIKGHFVQGRPGKSHSGEAVVYCPGNAMLYKSLDQESILGLQNEGISFLFLDPSQYGASRDAGGRTPRTDFNDLEAGIQFLMKSRRFEEGDISIIGHSLGSGAAIELSTKYEIDRLVLIVPFADLRSVMRRVAAEGVGDRLAKISYGISKPFMNDYFGYNNGEKIKHSKAARVTTYEGTLDTLMTASESGWPSEVSVLEAEYNRTHRRPMQVIRGPRHHAAFHPMHCYREACGLKKEQERD